MRAFLPWIIGCTLLIPIRAWAWSDFVHELICDQAYQRLSPPARKLVLGLTTGEVQPEGYQGFGAACVWPDEVRHSTHRATYEYHFINVPRALDIDLHRDCAAYDCVTQATQRYAIYLSQPERRAEQRAEALRFLGHFVADLHQPLHVGNREDRGGNDIFVFWQEQTETERLHSIWDGRIPETLGLREARTVEQELTAFTPQQLDAWCGGTVEDWAVESFRLAREVVYRDSEGEALKNGDRLDAAYVEKAEAVARQRIGQAIVRLTMLIERAAQGPMGVDDFQALGGKCR